MSETKWKDTLKTGRLSSNVEDRRGFNNMGDTSQDRVVFDKTPMHEWGKSNPAEDRGATMRRIEERVREYNKKMPKMGED